MCSDIWDEDCQEDAQEGIEQLKHCLDLCAEYQVPVMVCHVFVGFDVDYIPTQIGLDNFGKVIEHAKKVGVKIAFENTEGVEYLKAVLDRYKDEIINLDGFGEKSYNKMIEAIEASRNTTLDKFICGLSIPLIGSTASKTLVEWCDYDLMQVIVTISNYSISELPGFGEKMCLSLFNYLTNYKSDMQELAQEFNFIKPEKKEVKESIFTDKTFCITGSFSIGSRDELKEKIEGLGGKFVSSVSKKTGILVAGDKAGSKLTKATDLGIKIIDENELKTILGG
jgi:NAD-dependent DNA ligase